MDRNIIGSIYGRSSIKVTILVPDWSISKKIFSETILPNKATFYRKHLYERSSFHPDWTKDMVVMGNSCF
jgi:hypothetical protein